MAIYGYIRCTRLKNEKPPEALIPEIAARAKEFGGGLAQVFVDPGASEVPVLDRPLGKEMLQALGEEDILIVPRLYYLGNSMQDVQRTLGILSGHGVRICTLHDGLDLPPGFTKTLLQVFALVGNIEKALRSECFIKAAQSRKDRGLAYCNPRLGRKIVERDGVKVLEWDMDQLTFIAEIARRLPREGAAKVAQDFWRRGVKDRRGRPWGRQVPKPKIQAMAALEMLIRGRRTNRSPYQQFYRAARWFRRMYHAGLLPAPYDTLALTVQEPKSFRAEPKPRNWTPGGTARREQERADAKARHHADRLARWRQEKAARIQSRVHKPLQVSENFALLSDD
ncbi:MAG: recombinase family protein [Pirellulales bacterium]|nr:recombinase family protein [Pirellulales bacterium]